MNFRFRLPNHSSSVRFSSRPPGDEPAQVTSTSIWPKRSIVPLTARSMSSLFVMSPWTPSTRSSPPSSSTARRSVSSSRAVIATRQPSSTSSSAVARPIPRLAAVSEQRLRVELPVGHHEGDDLLAPALGRHARDRDLRHRGVLLEDGLDLAGIHVEATADDELLAAAGDLEAAV